MKGKSRFTASEIKKIEELIRKKLRALPTDQKAIRNEIRRLGFYYSDFRDEKVGYDVEDLRNLIKSGEVTIDES